MSWQNLPKIELHLHLEGAAPPDLIRRMAKERSVNLSRVFDEDGSYVFDDFAHFLEVYEAATGVIRTPEDYARLTTAVLEQSAEQGVIYTEAFLGPDFCGGGDLGAWREYLQAIREAAAAAELAHGIVMRGIVTCIRHFGPYTSRQTARCAAETAGDWIVGFGMGGNETMGRQGDFSWAFDCAREAGLRLTASATACAPSRMQTSSNGWQRPVLCLRSARDRTSQWDFIPACAPIPLRNCGMQG